jgi:hypothetical protein
LQSLAHLVQAALIEAGLRSGEFTGVPFPVNLPELYHYYVPLDATFFLTIYAVSPGNTWCLPVRLSF